MRPIVGLYKCKNYDVKLIEDVLEKSIEQNPSWLDGLKEGNRVFLKLNLLMKKRPEEAVTTHPAVVEAVVRMLQRRKAYVVIGDSPGGPYTVPRLKAIYKVCGLEEVAEKTNAELNIDIQEKKVSYLDGKVAKSFTLLKPVMDADFVISLPKLKTHMMTKYTGAVKNLFGTIPGMKKADYHLKMPDVADFADMLVDLALCVKPNLHIMDAIVGMEGHGPSSGDLRDVGALIISNDPFALDVVATSLVKIEPLSVPTIAKGLKRGMVGDVGRIELQGNSIVEWDLEPFKAPRLSGQVRFPIPDLIVKPLRPKPIFDAGLCISCGDCVANCPPKSVKLINGKPQVNLETCIRCFCCQELCPQKAVSVKRNPLGRWLER